MADRLYETDPETWYAHLAEGNARQPRKRVAADVIIRNQAGRLLLVNPNYKPDWDLPGGMAEANESPIDAARREIREELGLDLTIRTLLCIDWVPPHGPWDDTLVFVSTAACSRRRRSTPSQCPTTSSTPSTSSRTTRRRSCFDPTCGAVPRYPSTLRGLDNRVTPTSALPNLALEGQGRRQSRRRPAGGRQRRPSSPPAGGLIELWSCSSGAARSADLYTAAPGLSPLARLRLGSFTGFEGTEAVPPGREVTWWLTRGKARIGLQHSSRSVADLAQRSVFLSAADPASRLGSGSVPL